ncbi:MAG: PAS domain S-box protein [Candidatus Hydrogenedentes bacterium]|nr:PAS domain S-box protein [Candidatus Hydrogenedentota bacterium]
MAFSFESGSKPPHTNLDVQARLAEAAALSAQEDKAFRARLALSRRIILLAALWFLVFSVLSDVVLGVWEYESYYLNAALDTVSVLVALGLIAYFIRLIRGVYQVIWPLLVGTFFAALGRGLIIAAALPPLRETLEDPWKHKLYFTIAQPISGLGLVLLVTGLFLAIVQLIIERQHAASERARLTQETALRASTEQSLRQSESKYRHLVETLYEGIWVIDGEEATSYVNPRMAEMLGYAVEEMIGRKLFEFMDEAAREQAKHYLERRREGVKEQHDFEFRRKDGTRLYAMLETGPIMDEEGRYAGAIAGIVDITERKLAEDALRQSEERMRAQYEHFPIPTFTWRKQDGDFILADHNAAGLAMTEGHVLSWLGRTAREYLADRPDIQENLERCFAERNTFVVETPFELRHVPGEKRLVVEYVYVPPDSVMVHTEDVTARMAAEQERTRLVAAIEQAAEAVMITDAAGLIQYVNPAFERTSGYTRDEVTGKTPRLLRSGKQAPGFYNTLWGEIASGRVWQGRVTNKRKDGALYEEDMTITPVMDEGGNIRHYVALKRDVTKEVALERQLRQSQKMEAIGTLAGGIAHDMNNILSLVLGHCELCIDQTEKGSAARSHMHGIARAARRASDLVAQILAFSRQEEPERRPVAIAPAVSETVRFLRRSLPPVIQIRQHLANDGACVLAEATQIHQVVMNLCTNASHAMRQNGGVLEVVLESVEVEEPYVGNVGVLEPGPYVCLRVSDTGIGMDAATVDRVFEPFFTTKQPGEGTGLGLSTVLGIVKNCGGAIGVQSEPGKGSTFTLYLPRVPGGPPEYHERIAPPEGQYERILIVDDDEELCQVAADILSLLHYRVFVESSSLRALDRFLASPEAFDLLLLDNAMPHMDGIQMAIKTRAVRPGVPVIIMAGFADSLTESLVLEMGISELIQKPLDKEKLANTVRRVLDQCASA